MNKNKYQIMPELERATFEELKADIAKRGVIVPVLMDEQGNIIDGHNRVRACNELGIKEYNRQVIVGQSERQKFEIAEAVNNLRRHETRENRQKAIQTFLKNNPQMSNRQIGVIVGAHHTTVQTQRKELENGGEISHHETRIDARGTYQPAERKPVLVSNPTPKEEKQLQRPEIQERLQETGGDVREAVKKEYKEAREEQKQEIREKIKTENLIVTDKHDVVILDPPWAYGRLPDPFGSRVANPYPEMTQDEIMAKCGQFHKDNSIMYLWTTHAFLFDAKALLDAWGFEYKACLVWNKKKMGVGFWFRMQCEFCLVGVKGKIPYNNTTFADIFEEPRREHSRKPEVFYDMVKELHKDLRIFEYFSREKREGIINAGVELTE